MTSRIGDYTYDEGGLNVRLIGVEWRKCETCVEETVSIPRIEDLNRVIVRAIVEKPSRLSAAEVKFLRKSLGWSGVDFARQMHADPATVSRWENGAQPIGIGADIMLRLQAILLSPVEEYPRERIQERLAEVKDELTPALKLGARFAGKSWRTEQAAA